jgi:hypothetical protein
MTNLIRVAEITLSAVSVYPILKRIFKDDSKISERMAPKIKDSIADTRVFDNLEKKGKFVCRPMLSSQIADILNRKEATGIYIVIYGANGVGKSTIVDSAIQGRLGVLRIRITSASTVVGIMNDVAKMTDSTKLNPQIDDFIDAMIIALGKDGSVPTIILEIEREIGNEQNFAIRDIKNFAKEMSAVCNIILIVSAANAVLEFGKDIDCENFVFVDELSESEARECLAGLKLNLSEAEIKYLIDSIGANPATFNRMQVLMTGKGITVQDFVALKLSEAKLDLETFSYQQILKTLKEHPEGVSPVCFKKMGKKSVDLTDPWTVAMATNASNVLTYRIEHKKYMMVSRCHEVALRSYDPILPLSRWWRCLLF